MDLVCLNTEDIVAFRHVDLSHLVTTSRCCLWTDQKLVFYFRLPLADFIETMSLDKEILLITV